MFDQPSQTKYSSEVIVICLGNPSHLRTQNQVHDFGSSGKQFGDAQEGFWQAQLPWHLSFHLGHPCCYIYIASRGQGGARQYFDGLDEENQCKPNKHSNGHGL